MNIINIKYLVILIEKYWHFINSESKIISDCPTYKFCLKSVSEVLYREMINFRKIKLKFFKNKKIIL